MRFSRPSSALLPCPHFHPYAAAQYQMQVYGLWHGYDDACGWGPVPNMTTFDINNHWIIDRNKGNNFHPSVNVVVLCEAGVGTGASSFSIPTRTFALRQHERRDSHPEKVAKCRTPSLGFPKTEAIYA